MVFKRFKSIFGGREFTVRKEEPVKAWFYGKLLLGEIAIATCNFSQKINNLKI
ncbi:MAG: hypothetical protein IIY78_06085 [Clostridia bacterium]|nr:hypothetical protein [Clostridia bacterium]